MSTHPVEHDTRLLELYREAAKADQVVTWKLSTLRHITQPREVRWERDDRRSVKDIVDAVEALVEAGDERIIRYSGRTPSLFLGEYYEAVAALQVITDQLDEHEQAYTGWQRFFLVTSSNGLVHSSMSCHTCNKGRKATTFALLPSFSDRPVDGLVDLFGPALCSVCFPEAPTDWTDTERIPARIATTLLELGEDEFRAELEAFKTKRAVKAAKKGQRS